MVKINVTEKNLSDVPVKYCRIVLSEDKPTSHRLVETKEGRLEYRMGIGSWRAVDRRAFRLILRNIVQAAKSHQLGHIALQLSNSPFPKLKEFGDDWVVQTIAENLKLATYEYTSYKSKVSDAKQLKEILICGGMSASQKRSFTAGLKNGDSVNLTRDIANTPGDDMTPTKLASAVKKMFKDTEATVTVLNESEIKKHNMGLLHAVGKGADDRPCLIIIEHWGAGKPTKTSSDKQKQPIILVGKGITYDTGGLNVKPAGAMHDMHMDMSGGAAVIGTLHALATRKIKKNVVALIPAAENAISATSMRAGDIYTSMSGKTIEILHTDAEGRLVLADALTYAQKYYKPRVMLDAATLTGAALVALGQHASAVLTKHTALRETLQSLGEETGDLVWPLPLWDEYKQHLKGVRADINNVAAPTSRFGGCIEGGTFLSFFVDKKIPWAHIDIAPRMDSIPSDKLAKGALGEPVKLLIKFVETYK